jgi:hypothetical protein
MLLSLDPVRLRGQSQRNSGVVVRASRGIWPRTKRSGQGWGYMVCSFLCHVEQTRVRLRGQPQLNSGPCHQIGIRIPIKGVK